MKKQEAIALAIELEEFGQRTRYGRDEDLCDRARCALTEQAEEIERLERELSILQRGILRALNSGSLQTLKDVLREAGPPDERGESQ